jgi:hypothetical protein
MKQKKMNNNNDYKSEIQVAISTLVASLGFYKVQELTDFIKTIKNVSIFYNPLHNTPNPSFGELIKTDFTVIVFPFIGMLLYFGYLFFVAFSLYCIFKQMSPRKHQQSILYAVTCYFTLQVFMIGLTFAEKKSDYITTKKEFIIQTDSLYIHVPFDSIMKKKE